MRLKLLLLSLLLTGMLSAQDTIRTFIITEIRMDRSEAAYAELTNIGEDPIELSQFEFGMVDAWSDPYTPGAGRWMRLPAGTLEPGESFVIAGFRDYTEKMHPIYPDIFGMRETKKEWWDLADLQLHSPNTRAARYGIHTDSVSPNNYYRIFECWGQGETYYIEHHVSELDSVVVDQVGGVFDGTDVVGRNKSTAYDVAGVTRATATTTLVRKASVSQGNLNFNDARGNDIAESEWIPIPHPFSNAYDPYRAVFWTVGFHGDVTLDANTLQSDVLEVDFANKIITAPWGVRNNDDFMMQFEKVPGLAWHYDLSEAREDSAFNSARTGDKLTVYACGNTLQTVVFDIIVKEPTADDNIVMAKYAPNWDPEGSFYSGDINSGNDEYYQVTVDAPEMDTITNGLFGIGFATRVDSLLTYLEKAPNAQWEIVFVDDIERPDVKNGDILKVTAESGSVKEYFIKVNKYQPSHNADLASITWPDIPEDLKDLYGWIGDTIPGFNPEVTNYNLELQFGIEEIPALIASKSDLNSKLNIKRPLSLNGSDEQRSMIFEVTAEDDTTKKVYNVILEKAKDLADIQPFVAEPFVSELVFRDQWSNGFIEICNPGNQPLDLSRYMIAFMPGGTSNPAEAIEGYSGTDDWGNRLIKYVPGYKWVDEATWSISPGTLVQDFNVPAMLQPGDVFVVGQIYQTAHSGYPWHSSQQCDIILNYPYNPWGEKHDGWDKTHDEMATAAEQWTDGNFFMWKILNDSVLTGEKPANDPMDFELIEVFGQNGENWIVAGKEVGQVTTFIRKPEFYQGNPVAAASFGTNEEDCEWIIRDSPYFEGQGFGWPQNILQIGSNLGQHFFNEPNGYQTTVTSIYYKVSEGYSLAESIVGVRTGTTVNEFLAKLEKKYEEQVLTVKSSSDGSVLEGEDILNVNDTLVVLPAIGSGMTKYILDVSDEGLSSDAVLTSTLYTVEIENEPKSVSETAEDGTGFIRGFDYGTQLSTILNNVKVPLGATLSIIDSEGAFVSLKRMNFDTTMINVTVNANTYFDVVAEDGIARIVYQLVPSSSENDAFILSDVYSVSQAENLVHYVPRGTTVPAFLANVVPALNATVKIVDKLGNERTAGGLYEDDKIVVTSGNGLVTRVYHLAMLRNELIQNPVYLAYVLSNLYNVDQVNYQITGVPGTTTVADFYSRITPSWGATAVVVDADGNEKTSGDINVGDMVKVTSADGKIVVMYHLGVTSTEVMSRNQIEIYPNPTTGKLNVSGVEQGNRIQVFNGTGALVRDVKVARSLETVSLEGQPSGMYLIVISNDNQLLGRYKAIKK